ncbi:MAG: nucleotide sugar epimerase, partial [Bacteroidia bacterium]|nr:nucleotide sugar epimerase [Bacteroidia bacterium]MDW8058420.1 nucleotide sugar epimerase [Bacteroidia bacterium]
LGKKAQIIQHPFPKADLMHTQANIHKARTYLGWSPQTDFWTGLERTIEWHLANRRLLDSLPLP